MYLFNFAPSDRNQERTLLTMPNKGYKKNKNPTYLMIACVAHALLITCLAKKTPRLLASSSTPRVSSSFCHLKRKIKPYKGLQVEKPKGLCSEKGLI